VLPQRIVARLPGTPVARRDAAHPTRRRRADSVGRDRPGDRPRRGFPGGTRRRGVRDRSRGPQPPARDVEGQELRVRRRFPALHRSPAEPGDVRLSRSCAMTRLETARFHRYSMSERVRRAARLGVAIGLGAAATHAAAVTCTVSTPGLAFGSYDVYAAGVTNGNGTLTVSCIYDSTDT